MSAVLVKRKVRCHCCGIDIYGCTGSLSSPTGDVFTDPEFHCDRCTEFLLAMGKPCHVLQRRTDWTKVNAASQEPAAVSGEPGDAT